MFRLWAKIFKDNRMLQDLTISDDSREKNRTKKVSFFTLFFVNSQKSSIFVPMYTMNFT